jgi:hypothetical protein
LPDATLTACKSGNRESPETQQLAHSSLRLLIVHAAVTLPDCFIPTDSVIRITVNVDVYEANGAS